MKEDSPKDVVLAKTVASTPAVSSTPAEAREDHHEPPRKRQKKKIVPKQVQISNWTAPRRPFQAMGGATGVTVGKGGLRVLNMGEGDTSDLFDDTTDDSNSKRSKHSESEEKKGAATTPATSPATTAAPAPTEAAATTTTTATATVAATVAPAVAAAPKADHLRTIASMTEDDARRHNIPLSFWGNCRHVLSQYTQWCASDTAVAGEALRHHEAALIPLVEKSLCASTQLQRYRLRRETALQQLDLGSAPASGLFSHENEGVKFRELRTQMTTMEERKKALESSINHRARLLEAKDKKSTPSAAATSQPTRYCEPDFVLDGAERLELQFIRKEVLEAQRQLDHLSSARTAHTNAHQLQKQEDISRLNKHPVLDSRYLILSLIGKGGFSEVWKAFDRSTGDMVAVKVHQLSNTWTEERKQNFIRHTRRESEIQKNLSHAHIVKLLDCFDIDGSSFATVMEYTTREDLATYLQHQGGMMRERDAKIILRQILCALSYLSDPTHPTKIIHYDIKPPNILFFEQMTIKLTDFGLSKQLSSTQGEIELTSHGAGTFSYLPPECFGDGEKISTKVDIWSAGVVFFQLLFGKKPFVDGGRGGLGLGVGPQGDLELPSSLRVSEFSRSIVKKMLSPRAEDRPTAAAILKEFEDEEDDAEDNDATSTKPSPNRSKRKRVTKEEALAMKKAA